MGRSQTQPSIKWLRQPGSGKLNMEGDELGDVVTMADERADVIHSSFPESNENQGDKWVHHGFWKRGRLCIFPDIH
jgi:hypothetical protein